MTSIEKLKFAEQQIINIANGRAAQIDCPFCHETTTRQKMLICCEPMADLTDAILHRIEAGENIAMAKEAVDRARYMADRQRQNMIVSN